MTAAGSLTAVLACHEEAGQLAGVVTELGRALSALVADWNIVLVCSAWAADGTPDVARALGAADPRVRTLIQPAQRRGYGRAVALGLHGATSDWVLLMDGDGQLDPGDIARLWSARADTAIVLGARRQRAEGARRALASRWYGGVARLLLSLPPVRDLDCALKLLPRRFVIDARLRSRSGAVNAELVRLALDRGAHIVEVDVAHRPRAGGQGRFQLNHGPLTGLPRPSAALELGADLVALVARRSVRR